MIHPEQRIITDQIIENTKLKIVNLNLLGIHIFVGKSRLIVIEWNGQVWVPRSSDDLKTNKKVRQVWHIYKRNLIIGHPGESHFWKIPIPREGSNGFNNWLCCTQFYPVPDDRGESSKWHDCNIPYIAGVINQNKWPQEWREYIPIYSDYLIFGQRTPPSKIRCRYCQKIIKSSDPRRIYCNNNDECKKKALILTRKIKNETEHFFNKAATEGKSLDLLAKPDIDPDTGDIEWTPQIPNRKCKTSRKCKICKSPIPLTKHGKIIFCDECNTPAKRMSYYRSLWKMTNQKKG